MWIAQGNCGDYYCDGGHFLGVFTTEENARRVVQKYINQGSARDGSVSEHLIDVENDDYVC